MGCIVSSVACCFCSAAASLCCSCLPSCKNSTSSRIMFSLILIVAALLSALAIVPGIRSVLMRIPALCTPFAGMHSGLNCDLITGFGAVYRLCFATTMFYLLFSLLMIRVRSSQDCRAKVQNGFWFFKFLLWFLIVICAFLIPVEGFTTTWMIIGMIGGALYILVQLVLLIDFAHTWNTRWLDSYESTEDKCYAFGLVFFTFGFYAASIAGVGLLFYFYANAPECALNKAFISINLIFCVCVSVVSMLPQVRERLPVSGLLQSSLITAYVVFLTWSALTNSLIPNCNPSLSIEHRNSTNSTVPIDSVKIKFDWHVGLGLLILVLSVIYSSIRSSSHTAVGQFTVSGVEHTELNEGTSGPLSKQDGKQTVWDDEEDGVTYNYSMFHFMLMLATLYMMMMLTNWVRPQSDLRTLAANDASYWVRIVSSWVCLLLYLWTMIAPTLFPDREF
ncbi:unnamed protein product [Calicophoron daubneyi]|uniref:Serine incorporator n=1 Tax=Calicophoron daubneyi TaxID=300641 RepID=A0AAV2T5R2_CALDB